MRSDHPPAADPPSLVCLLPAQNEARDLPGCFESVGGFCDAVVALDDGSTDVTAEILARSPLVATLLRNPRRTGYGGWNDAVNRNRLLRAAALLRPEWIPSLDADERIDAGDGAAIRRFLPTDALPGLAYGLPCHAMAEADGVGDEMRYADQPLWVWRLFAFQHGQRFPDDRLHFAPVPVGTPRNAHMRTTIRIQHLAMTSDEHRRARFEKYRQADPDCRFWPDYSPILHAPAESDLRPWLSRPENLPVVAGAATSAFIHAETVESRGGSVGPEFAFALIVLVGTNPISARRSIQSAIAQRIDERFEVVVVAPDGTDMGLEGWNLPQNVSLRHVTHFGTPGSARNAGLAASSAPFVAFLPGELTFADGSLAAMLRAHREGYASVGGSVSPDCRPASNRALQWIAYSARRPAERGVISTTPR
ncbi:MAG: glycosyltransferase family 2 protein [Thermomicrobiales bacterium]